MHKILGFLLIMHCFSMSFTQTYFEDGDVWKVYTKYAHQYPCVDNIYVNYAINGDSIVGSYSYKKVFEQSFKYYTWESPIPAYPQCTGSYEVPFYLKGLLRQEGKKVYFIENGQLETELFNFDLIVGDTVFPSVLNGVDTSFVTSIDSINVNGVSRKLFEISNVTETYQLIEGIGSTHGLLEPRYNPYNILLQLECYSRQNLNYFPVDQTDNCLFYLGTLKEEIQLQVYPNPIVDLAQMNLPFQSTVAIFSINGNVMAQFRASQGMVDLDFSDYESGVYYLQIQQEDGKIVQKRLLKL